MNAKKVKALRQSLTRIGIDRLDVEYEGVKVGAYLTGQLVLKKTCGRAKYKFVKARSV